MFDGNFVEAMPACFVCFALAQLGTRPCALCMFDRNFVEAMLACFVCFALAQRGERPCACLINMFWKRCWHVSHVSLWPNVGRGLVHV